MKKNKKDNGLRAVICLAVATVAIGAASIAVSKMDNSPVQGTPQQGDQQNVQTGQTQQPTTGQNQQTAQGKVLDITGANAKIKEARLNDDGTYTVVIAEEGFGGEITIEAIYSADGQTLVSYDVLSHSETPTIGSLVDEADYKAVLAGVKLPVTANGLDISAIIGTVEETPEVSGTEETTTEAAALTDGVYTAQAEADEKGNYPFVSITVEGGKIVAATWDEVYNGSLKSELSTTGKYVMKPVWDTQAKNVSQYVVDNQGTAGLVNEKGKTDVVSGVSITVSGFATLADQAIAQANGKDGVYEVKAEADDKGNYAFVSVTIEGGKITAVTWDEVYNGSLKSVLSTTGQYVMKPVWDTQAKSMCQYVVDNQTTEGLNLTEAGKTDVVSGVSITVTGFTGLIEDCIAQAANAAAYKDGVYTAQAEADEKGNYPFVSVTIEGGKIVAVTWDEVYNGSLKSELSTTGKYVMKPVWDTQAKNVSQYVVDNQGTAGLVNEKGKTDVVSGVSITVSGFATLADQAIAQANGKDGVYEVKAEADEKGNYAFVSVTIEGGKITAVTWDEVYNGSLKSVLSTTGQYVMKPVWDTQAKSMCQYVVDNQTTGGLNLTEAGKTDVVSGVSITVTGFTSLVEDCLAQACASYKDGVYEVAAPADEKGNYPFVSVTIKNGKIVAVTWDEVYNGSLKSELSTTGKYVMKPVWDTQAKNVSQYVVDNQGTAGLVNEKGKTDVVSGVSITVSGFATLADQAIAQANGKDGVYEVKAEADEKGNYAFVSVTIEGGKITAVTWDEVYNGSLKSVLSTTGQYVMKPVWDTQAKSMCQYVVDNQTTGGLNLTEAGKTDVVSGVSITVTGFTGLVEEALKQASVTGAIPAPAPVAPAPATKIDATVVDVVSGATISSKAVIRAIDEGFVFLRDFILNK